MENELISVVVNNDNNQTTTFAYDASGLRTKTVEPAAKITYTPFPGVEEEVAGAAPPPAASPTLFPAGP